MECDYTLVSLICLKVYQIIHVGYDCFEIIYTELNQPQNRVLTVRSGALFRLTTHGDLEAVVRAIRAAAIAHFSKRK